MAKDRRDEEAAESTEANEAIRKAHSDKRKKRGRIFVGNRAELALNPIGPSSHRVPPELTKTDEGRKA